MTETTPKRGRGRPRTSAAAKAEVKRLNNARYYEANKDTLKTEGKEYEAAHSDERSERNKAYHDAHRDAHIAAMAARYAANKDEINRKKREARAAKKAGNT